AAINPAAAKPAANPAHAGAEPDSHGTSTSTRLWTTPSSTPQPVASQATATPHIRSRRTSAASAASTTGAYIQNGAVPGPPGCPGAIIQPGTDASTSSGSTSPASAKSSVGRSSSRSVHGTSSTGTATSGTARRAASPATADG